jgi:hypothetical protein
MLVNITSLPLSCYISVHRGFLLHSVLPLYFHSLQAFLPRSFTTLAKKKAPNMTDYGEFVDSDDEQAVEELEESAESLILYFQPPFYCPTLIGNILAQRYRIEHKLGHGGFSTVWMAHDIKTKKDVALKISVLTGNAADHEWRMHKEIRRRVRDTSKLLISHEDFTIQDSNTHHKVLVFPLCGPSLSSCFVSMSMADRMSALKQVLEALKSLHDANIVHRGSFRLLFVIFALTKCRSE